MQACAVASPISDIFRGMPFTVVQISTKNDIKLILQYSLVLSDYDAIMK